MKSSEDPVDPVDPDFSTYVAGWKKRIARDRDMKRQWLEHANREAVRLAQLLIKDYGARRVYLIGSLTHGRVHDRSDIDLAVEGLAPELYILASTHVQRETDIPVDLIDLDAAHPSMIKRVAQEGKLLAE